MLHEQINYVDARVLAEERDIRIAVTKERSTPMKGGSIQLRALGGDRPRSVTGMVNGNGEGPILTEIDGYGVSVAAKGRLLLAYNVDRPGIIGKVGTLLGETGSTSPSCRSAENVGRTP